MGVLNEYVKKMCEELLPAVVENFYTLSDTERENINGNLYLSQAFTCQFSYPS